MSSMTAEVMFCFPMMDSEVVIREVPLHCCSNQPAVTTTVRTTSPHGPVRLIAKRYAVTASVLIPRTRTGARPTVPLSAGMEFVRERRPPRPVQGTALLGVATERVPTRRAEPSVPLTVHLDGCYGVQRSMGSLLSQRWKWGARFRPSFVSEPLRSNRPPPHLTHHVICA